MIIKSRISYQFLESWFHFLILSLILTSTIIPQVSADHPEASVSILSHDGFLDSVSQYHVVGEVKNVGEVNVEFVKVTAKFFDSGNAPLGEGYVYSEVAILVAGQKSPFEIVFIGREEASLVDHYDLEVSFVEAPLKAPYREFQIVYEENFIDELDWIHITGELSNSGENDTTQVKAISTFYDSGGEVVGIGFAFSDPINVDAEENADFEIILTEQVEDVDNYELQIECGEYIIIPEFSKVIIVLISLLLLTAFLAHARDKSIEDSKIKVLGGKASR